MFREDRRRIEISRGIVITDEICHLRFPPSLPAVLLSSTHHHHGPVSPLFFFSLCERRPPRATHCVTRTLCTRARAMLSSRDFARRPFSPRRLPPPSSRISRGCVTLMDAFHVSRVTRDRGSREIISAVSRAIFSRRGGRASAYPAVRRKDPGNVGKASLLIARPFRARDSH